MTTFIASLWAHLVRKRHFSPVDGLTYVTCYDCRRQFWGRTEFEAALALSKHSIFDHDEAPSEEDGHEAALCLDPEDCYDECAEYARRDDS